MRFVLLLAILMHDILGHARYRSPRVYDDDDRESEVSRRHDRHMSWRSKALAAMDPDYNSKYKRREDPNDRDEEDHGDTRAFFEDTLAAKAGANKRRRKHKKVKILPNYDVNDEENVSIAPDEYVEIEPISVKRSAKTRELGYRQKATGNKKLVQATDCDRNNERFDSCFSGCAAVSCDNPRDRLRPCYPFCEPGCVCADPYVRDERTHKCVLPADCTMYDHHVS